MRAMRRLAVVLVLALGTLAATATPARADLGGAVYDDVRDVIEELIRSEVTHSVVTTIETRSPALAFYMHGTLERLGSPYWGSLGRALQQDLTVTVADFVYWHLAVSDSGDIATSARRFFACLAAPTGDPACARLVAAVTTQRRPLLEVECRRVKPAPDRRVACDIGLAALAALEQRGAVRHHVLDALADIVIAEIDDRGLHDRLADLLTHWLDKPDELPSSLLDALADPDLVGQLADPALEKLCNDPKMVDDFIHDPEDSTGWLCFAISHGSLPAALGAHVSIHDGDGALDTHVEYWNIATALHDFNADTASDDSAFRLLADLAFDARCPAGAAIEAWPCKGPRLGPGATITVSWLGRELTGIVDASGLVVTKPRRGMLLWTLRFRKAMKRVEQLRALVPPSLSEYLFFPGSSPPDARVVLRTVARMARLVAELRARWYLWTPSAGATTELDVAELVHVARDAIGNPSATTGAMAAVARSLGFLDQQHGGGSSTLDIGDWLRLVMRRDYRALAMESLRAALDLRLGDTGRPRETFFVTLTSYLLDAGQGVDETVARSAFRAAAKDLLAATTRVGLPSVAHRTRFGWLPRIAVGLSFDDNYAAIAGADSRRTVVAAQWPTAMVAVSDYLGFEASLLDGAAPLAELALRSAGAYHDERYVALDLVRPRLGLWVAMPALSKRLALTTGIAGRFVHVASNRTYSEKASLVFDAGLELVF